MKREKKDYISTHGAGGHDFITSGAGVPSTRRYTYIEGWGGSADVTYTQQIPGGEISGMSATVAAGSGIHNPKLTNVAVTDGGTIIAYRAV